LDFPREPQFGDEHGHAQPVGPDAAPPQEDPSSDPLMEALLWLCRHHGVERTEVSLLNGLVLSSGVLPSQAVRLLEGAGFNATIIRRPPSKILSLLMPVVLLLRNGDVCVVTKRVRPSSRRQTSVVYEVVMPGAGDAVCVATEDELTQEYSGFALIASPKSSARHAVPKGAKEEPPHWMWHTMKRYMPYYRAAMVAALLSNVLMMMTGMFTAAVYDKVIPHKAFVTLWSLGIGTML